MSKELLRPQKFKTTGVIYYEGYTWKYYDESVKPGGGLNIPGRHTDDNLVKDKYGNICLASSDLDEGDSLLTPILDPSGNQYTGVVYDDGPQSGVVDVYVSFKKKK